MVTAVFAAAAALLVCALEEESCEARGAAKTLLFVTPRLRESKKNNANPLIAAKWSRRRENDIALQLLNKIDV